MYHRFPDSIRLGAAPSPPQDTGAVFRCPWPSPPDPTGRTEKLQKLIAAAGLCSRRHAEELLRQGRVRLNGQPAALGERADPRRDRISVDGRPR